MVAKYMIRGGDGKELNAIKGTFKDMSARMDQMAGLLEVHTTKTAVDISAINDSQRRVIVAQDATQSQLSELTCEADKRNLQSEAKFNAAAGQIGDLSHLLASFLREGVRNKNATEQGIKSNVPILNPDEELDPLMGEGNVDESWCALVCALTAPNLTSLRPAVFRAMADFCVRFLIATPPLSLRIAFRCAARGIGEGARVKLILLV